jgi:hypothetical protein
MKMHSVTQVQALHVASAPNEQFKLTHCATQSFVYAEASHKSFVRATVSLTQS